ncbi:DUF2971 domain-containing protein [Vibrio cholerae]|uniref:DUF2971 domain-containing protein n=1 Tax=Vibrio cholerae TaxID=666 RepID=UPI000E09FA86|nr:DUF2971 domain-containing protein [Vibrio cholerae]EJL6601152.1 DUF2971 domain-containing protein [Vibrio cholerae]EKF9121812.1 DUF2971 domain-containing protein [Vibrio cholerae]ELG4778660.1 DUF2971 domain-containing protein [Vibrio cholerae]ELK8296017.1 DUF2971 domain-containing protein [Vibrio cholerae]
MKLKLYKYLPFDQGAKCLLKDGTMKFSSYDTFNDPFDCVVSYDLEEAENYMSSRKDLIKAAGDKIGLSPAKRLQNRRVMLKRFEHSLVNGKASRDIAKDWGVCCLSSRPDNILMWSHYADNHKGLLVEFTTDQNHIGIVTDPEFYLTAWPIEYTENMPVRKISVRDFEAVKEQFLCKSMDWAYEKEHRCLSHRNGPGIYPFDKTMVTKVIAGLKMSDADFIELKQLVAQFEADAGTRIEFKRAEMVKGKYQLNVV